MSTTPNDGWFKSSYSGDPNGNCVEAHPQPGAVHIRDSKRVGEPQHDVLGFSTKAWAAFTGTL
ncbi:MULTISPECIES: DUF397 domain-containing protein [Streptomyces]|uniref:DUF397 domain-containing protein n=1 Tax=Streptomyces TaxID=1883 RepID=UPI00226F8A53|nr:MULTISPECIES: DUF397 domain-containing protein [unclassified Streptomyces]MCY0940183.1 DUF397 domain-containing protein [Streptomyces sp. H34-AA3]MCZ4080830.1 DUF397 domain-containing protein [Streptomyces sp. H34-S5]